MTGASGTRTVRLLFLIVLLTLIAPSRLMALGHGAPLARVLGATVSTLLVCWFLYRLCMRANRQAWFIAISIPAVYVAVFGAPIYAWGTLLALTIVHRAVVRRLPAPPPSDPISGAPDRVHQSHTAIRGDPAPMTGESSIQVVGLARVCMPYRRFLFSQRIVRAAVAALASSALLSGPTIFFIGIAEPGALSLWAASAVLLTLFLVSACVLYFSWMRALWRGSVRAGYFGLLVTGLFSATWVVASMMALNRELFVTGGIWFHVTAHVLQLSLIGAMGMGSAIVVRRRNDRRLMRMLAQNATHNWRDAVLLLSGVVFPRGRLLRALTHKGFVLSALAFCIEGAAFYVYFRAASRLLRTAELVAAPYPGSLTPLEGHYFHLATIACLVLPVMYVTTQLTLTVAERIRNAARRASMRPADELLKEDERRPVLFLRDFRDDQVSLHRAAAPGWLHHIDPGIRQANLEEMLQGCLSVGPVVAIGRPADAQPPIGAARRYVQGEDWRDVVRAMMDAAATIVVGTSESAGVVWEIEQLRDRGHLGKSVFVMPPGEGRNGRLACNLVARLLSPAEMLESRATAIQLSGAVGSRHIVGLTLRHGILTFFVSEREPSQVEFEVALRLSRESAEDANVTQAIPGHAAPAGATPSGT